MNYKEATEREKYFHRIVLELLRMLEKEVVRGRYEGHR